MHKFPNDVNIRVSFHRLCKEFQKTLKETRHKFFNAMIQKLDDLHENNPKIFWETIDKKISKFSFHKKQLPSNQSCFIFFFFILNDLNRKDFLAALIIIFVSSQ
jgi:hypothetical protein